MAKVPTLVSFGWAGEKREIKVIKKRGKWVTSHFIGGKPDPTLIGMYGTHEVPTPWNSRVDRETVINELKVRNTNSTITAG